MASDGNQDSLHVTLVKSKSFQRILFRLSVHELRIEQNRVNIRSTVILLVASLS